MYNRLFRDFYKGKELYEVLKDISVQVWERIGFVRESERLKVHEPSITQEILYQLAIAADASDFNIQLNEAESESTDGNDIECFVEIEENRFLCLPLQAKIIYDRARYPKMNHKVGKENREQVDLLINYAQKKKGIPLYLLYNYVNENDSRAISLKKMIGHPLNLFGVSFVSAYVIKENYQNKGILKDGRKEWRIPTFYDLHGESALPFHKIIDEGSFNIEFGLLENEEHWSSLSKEGIQFYTYEEIQSEKGWKEIPISPSTGAASLMQKESLTLAKGKFPVKRIKKIQDFAPAHQILLSIRKRRPNKD